MSRLASAASAANPLAWRRLRCALDDDDGVVIWRRDAVLQAGGFAADAADASLDMMVRIQAPHHGTGGESVVRTGEIFGRTSARPFAERLRVAAQHQAAVLQLLWRHRRLIGVGELGARTIPLFALTEVFAPGVAVWALAATCI